MTNQCCCGVGKGVGLVLIIGALNWGAVGFFHTDLVARFLGAGSQASTVVYCAVGLAGVMKLISLFVKCPCQK